jgi:beta-carotene 3-hydroxylase
MFLILVNAFCFIGCFLLWEAVAWFTHKYIMHGFLWSLHEDHHKPGYRMFEKNDLFGLFFAGISAGLILLGLPEFSWIFWCGAGIAAYGAAYFFVHDIFVHRRLPWFRNTNSRYLMALRKAHKIHHKQLGRLNAEAFGFLYVLPKYWPQKHNHK